MWSFYSDSTVNTSFRLDCPQELPAFVRDFRPKYRSVIRINLRQLKEDFYRDNADFTNLVDLLNQCVLASKQNLLTRDEAGKQ